MRLGLCSPSETSLRPSLTALCLHMITFGVSATGLCVRNNR